MVSWFRSWHGAPTDNKWLLIARRAKTAPGIVSAVAWALLDYASQNADRGSIKGFDVEVYATFSGFDEDVIQAIITAMQEKGVITQDERLAAWEKRQPKREDDSTERVRNWRNTQRNAEKRNVTQCNAPDTDTDTDTKSETELTDTESEEEQTQTPSPAWAAFVKARGVNLTPLDSQQVAELEQMYGTDAVAQAITYCNASKKQNFLSLRYIIAVLNGWQADGTLGLHGENGNGHKPEPKYRYVEQADGTMRREVVA